MCPTCCRAFVSEWASTLDANVKIKVLFINKQVDSQEKVAMYPHLLKQLTPACAFQKSESAIPIALGH